MGGGLVVVGGGGQLVGEQEAGQHGAQADQPHQQAGAASHQVDHLLPLAVSIWQHVDPDRGEPHVVDDADVAEDVDQEGGQPGEQVEGEEGEGGGGRRGGGGELEAGL